MPESTRASARTEGSSRRSKADDVSFSHSKKVSIPSESSSVSSWARFSAEANAIVLSGYSLAVALGENVDAAISSPMELAEQLLTSREREMYAAWKKDRSPPAVNWRKINTAVNANTSIQKARWNELTEYLRILYNEPRLTRENCKAWVEKYVDYMPLLQACKKVEMARADAKSAKSSSKAVRHVREMVSCRSVMAHVGRQKIRSNTTMKAMNKEAADRERDLQKRLDRLDADLPRDKESVIKRYQARETYWEKLTKTRVDRLKASTEVERQNSEINALETMLKVRIRGLEDRLKASRS